MRRINLLMSAILVSILAVSCCKEKEEKFDTQKALDYCVEKTQKTISNLADVDSLPRNIYSNQTQWNKVGIEDWTSGFWPGILWYAYEASGDTMIEKEARKFTSLLEPLAYGEPLDHDLGFQIFNSYGNGYRLTKDSAYKEIIISTANKLSKLYNPKVGTILSWPVMVEKMNWPHNTIIDNMINLELLFSAAKNGGDQHLYDIAVQHAETCMHTLIRPDYSTFHVAVFDTIDGHFIKGVTHQGYADSSLWARGQGWGIYGYTMSYRETGKVEFLETAMKLADVFISRLPEDGIPYWDFNDPDIPNAPKDASAAAVAASGMLELSEFMKDESDKLKYRNAAIALLTKLSSPEYLSGDTNEAFLLHSTGHKPKGSEIDASIIYADYYYLEALLRLKKIENNDK